MASMSSVEAIETEYGGTRYRSRLEARWAVLFDADSIAYQYEPDGFKLPSGWYLPDFWVPAWDCFFEVKNATVKIEAGYYGEERTKAEELTAATNKDVLFGCGDPVITGRLSRVPVLGISPIQELLIEYVSVRAILKATKHRFDWSRPASSGRIGDWEMLGRPAWRAVHNANKKRPRS